MARKNLQQGLDKQGKGEDVEVIYEERKIDVEIRDIIRIRPQDFSALKNSFEEWARQWD